MSTTRNLTQRELNWFQRKYAGEIGRHQRVVAAMRASGISMLRTEPAGANDAMPRRRFGRDAENSEHDGVIAEREGARNYGGARTEGPGRQETVDEADDFADLREHLKDCGLADDDVEHAVEIARAAREDAEDEQRRRRHGRDEPPPFSGQPRPGGGMRPIAGDSAAARASFARRFPGAARIRFV